ncbi:unnamed protein product [Meganyctiphanes norvegica]|uniref:Uncharacterized protein n=1 Tax=Meganyctiphanes norvegica TaxID=48144 RepID=A0AAV2RZD2_MEGNR
MGQHSLLRLIFVVAVLARVYEVNAITCYDCSVDPDDPDYDPDCGRYDFDGNTFTYDGDTCYTVIYDNGDVARGLYGYAWMDDGDCSYWPGKKYCYCKTDYCNTHSYCEQCEQ